MTINVTLQYNDMTVKPNSLIYKDFSCWHTPCYYIGMDTKLINQLNRQNIDTKDTIVDKLTFKLYYQNTAHSNDELINQFERHIINFKNVTNLRYGAGSRMGCITVVFPAADFGKIVMRAKQIQSFGEDHKIEVLG